MMPRFWDHQLEALSTVGIKDVVIVVGYEKQQIINHVTSRKPSNGQRIHFIENPAFAITNNVYSRWLALDWVRDDSFIVLNADVIFDADILATAVPRERLQMRRSLLCALPILLPQGFDRSALEVEQSFGRVHDSVEALR